MYRAHLTSIAAAALLAVSPLPGLGQTAGDAYEMVHIGASQMGGVARVYGARLGEDLGVSVQVWYRNANHSGAAAFLASAQGKIVDDADIVFVGMLPVAGHYEGYCLDSETDQPFNQTPQELRADIDGFLAELVQHADPAQKIVRIVLMDYAPRWKAMWEERGVVEDCAAAFMARNAQWTEAAAGYGIPVIDLTAAWFGPDGLGTAPEGYVMTSLTGNLTPEGEAAAAELVRAVGYAPLAE